MKKAILALVLMGAFTVASATNGGANPCGNHGNNCDTGSGTVNNGGNGGAGGQGGSGTVVGVGIAVAGAASSATGGSVGDIRNTNTAAGGSVIGSGNSSNENRNTNTNSNTNAQGQLQGQQQGQGQSQTSKSNAQQSQSTRNSNNSKQSVNVEGDTYEAARIPVATAYASAPMPSAPCMGSSAVGAQGALVGVSVSTTWTSAECNNRENVRFASTYGDKDVAEEMLRATMPGYAEAEKRIADRKAGKVSAKSATVAAAPKANAIYSGDDPIVRARLGLPPLK